MRTDFIKPTYAEAEAYNRAGFGQRTATLNEQSIYAVNEMRFVCLPLIQAGINQVWVRDHSP